MSARLARLIHMQSYLICDIQGQRFAFDVETVLEAVRMPWVTAIAETPPGVCGVVNYRGSYVAVVDPALRLVGKAAERGLDSYLVVLGVGHDRVALVVDRVDGLLRAPAQPVPEGAGSPVFVLGHLDDQRGVITVLDTAALLRPEVLDFVEHARETQVPPP